MAKKAELDDAAPTGKTLHGKFGNIVDKPDNSKYRAFRSSESELGRLDVDKSVFREDVIKDEAPTCIYNRNSVSRLNRVV